MPPIVESILNELREESVATRRILERIPSDKLSFRPHQRSRPLGELAMHVANIPRISEKIANHDEWSPGGAPTAAAGSREEILAAFEGGLRAAEDVLGTMTDQAALANWRFTFKGREIFNKPRAAALRTNLLNHLYHHRGQLSVYLRLLDVPVPMVYGPTADYNPFA
jgi:uncharacterized damage-inducible protein DinB